MTTGIDIRSARSLVPAERAELFNAAYEGYLVPFHIDEHQLAFMDDAFDLDLDASRIAYRDGEPVALQVAEEVKFIGEVSPEQEWELRSTLARRRQPPPTGRLQ